MTNDRDKQFERWKRLMSQWPSDGWEGAAAARASHARMVREIEAEMDSTGPEWRDDDLGSHSGYYGGDYPNAPITRDPREAMGAS